MKPTVDCFASKKNARFERFFDRKTNGFSKNWREEICWINGPWTKLEDIVNKVVRDRARGIMIVPTWVDRDWFKALGSIAVSWVDLPHD